MKPFPNILEIVVGARNSLLSKRQVEEAEKELKKICPQVVLFPVFVETVGDRDKITSLRSLDKTDFFTREIDQLVLDRKCRIGIHSAKDLPDPLPFGLKLGALTQGIDPADVLVIRSAEEFPKEGIVATSSVRREEAVRLLFPHVSFVDIRGTIQERLLKLEQKEVDGVVIAEAALIRLGLTHLHRFRLPGETAPLQGKLAFIIHKDDHEMAEWLRPIGLDD